jgi:hypothetical protein
MAAGADWNASMRLRQNDKTNVPQSPVSVDTNKQWTCGMGAIKNYPAPAIGWIIVDEGQPCELPSQFGCNPMICRHQRKLLESSRYPTVGPRER